MNIPNERSVVALAGASFAQRLATSLTDRFGIGVSCRRHDLDSGPGEPDAIDPGQVWIYAPATLPDSVDGPSPEAVERAIACLRAAAPTFLILVSSAEVHEPHHRHPGLVQDEAWVDRRTGNRIAAAWRHLEAEVDNLGVTETLVLRPVAIADLEGGFVRRALRRRVVAGIAGHDPAVQLVTLDDVAQAVVRGVEQRTPGVHYLVPTEAIPWRKALALAGVRRLPLPWWLLRLWHAVRPGKGAADTDRLAYLRYAWTVSPRPSPVRGNERSSADAVASVARRRPATVPSGFDPHGLDEAYIAAFGRTTFRFLHDVWWRVDTHGLEHVPADGRAMLVGIHRGFMPWDGVMLLHLLARERRRHTRFLIHPTLIKMPFLFNHMRKLGGLPACQENAEWVLEREGLLGIFPEGIRGAFSLYREAYTLKPFGRDAYVRMALRHQAPIVPVVTIGSAETFPILARWRWRAFMRWSEWPFLPITPTFPFLPIPLPSKWHTRFLPAIDLAGYPPEAADDPKVVRALSAAVREQMATTLEDLRRRRPGIFRGRIANRDESEDSDGETV